MFNLVNFKVLKIVQVPVRRPTSPGGWETLVYQTKHKTNQNIIWPFLYVI